MIKPALFTASALGLLLALAGPAAAQYAPVPYTPPAHEHKGVFVRAYLGPAYFKSKASDASTEIAISGTGGAFGLAVGYAVTPNLIVYGELADDVAIGPTLEINGSSSTASDDISAGVVGFGVGVAYYFMPVNAYVSGTLSASQLSIQENGNETGDTETGPGLSIMAGKEWWVGQNLGVGVAAQAFFGSQPERNSDVSWTTSAFALVLSASYN